MKTLQIESGDLVIGPGGAQLLTGQARVIQDLSIASLEPFGCDRFHPNWGSVLTNYIGMPITDELRLLVQSEVTRLVSNYMVEQNTEIQADADAGRRSRFQSSEILVNLTGVEVRATEDKVQVRAILQTLSGEQMALQSTVRN